MYRLAAARGLPERAARKVLAKVGPWPDFSPGSVNAWLLLVTTKPPWWRDPFVAWREQPLTVGQPHEGFFYPDPLGFWTEVRRWATELLTRYERAWVSPDVLALTTLVHLGEEPARFATARRQCRPGVVLFLDDAAWKAAALEVTATVSHLPDPHRRGVVYEGFWGVDPSGTIIGKAPQHPATHKLYRSGDMSEYLRAAPIPEANVSTD